MSELSGKQPPDAGRPTPTQEPMSLAGTGGSGKPRGRGRQSVGEAFFMSLIRQVARGIGTALVRAVVGRRR